MTDTNWDFECPQFCDFDDPKTWENNDQENDAYFGVKQIVEQVDSGKKLLESKLTLLVTAPKVEVASENSSRTVGARHDLVVEEIGKKLVEAKLTAMDTAPKVQVASHNGVRTILGARHDLPVEEIKSNLFKATPMNRKIFEPQYVGGIPRITPAKSCIKTIGFNFRTEERLKQRKGKPVCVNASALVEKQKHKPPTSVPHTPVLRTPTVQKPFSFVDRDIQKWNEKREQLRKKETEGPVEQMPVFHFKAQPVASKVAHRMQPRSTKPPTKAIGFSFHTEGRLKSWKPKGSQDQHLPNGSATSLCNEIFKKPLPVKARRPLAGGKPAPKATAH